MKQALFQLVIIHICHADSKILLFLFFFSYGYILLGRFLACFQSALLKIQIFCRIMR